MPTHIHIPKVDWANTPGGIQTSTFEYKLFSATTWTLISNVAAINPDGTLLAPIDVFGLTAGQLYYVRWHNNCDSPPVYYTQQFQL